MTLSLAPYDYPNSRQTKLSELYDWDPVGIHDHVLHFLRQLRLANLGCLEDVFLFHLLNETPLPWDAPRYDLPAPFSIADFIDAEYARMLRQQHAEPERLVG